MKKAILIAGVSGSGKSEVGRRLKDLGYETYDTDALPGLCVMVDKITLLPTEYDNNNDLEKIQKMKWLCKLDELENLISNQKNDIAYYCGAPNNLEEMVPLFDQVILLVASPNNIRQRLNARQDNGFGKSVEVQDHILNHKESIEKYLIEKGAIVIDADQDINLVVEEVIRKSK